MASEELGIREFLEKNNLAQYFENFIDQGYDDMDQILSMANNPLELDSLMKDVAMFEKPGHKKRFVGAVQILASKAKHGEPGKSPETGMNTPESSQRSANDATKWPSVAKNLWIPNPLTPQLTFHNMVLEGIYNSSFELMAPLQFKEYVISQRVSRWKIEKGLTDLQKKIQNQLDPESRDGRAQNIARFSADTLNTIKPGDLFKAESSQKEVRNLLDEVLKKKQEITELRSNLFDKNMNIKPWRANELMFYDSKKTLLEELNKTLQKTHTMIITNSNLLKRRANASTEETAEAKRKKRSARTNARKSAKEKENRFINKVNEVLKLVTDGKFTQVMVKEREGISIRLKDINQNCQLVARFHHKALSWLIKEDYFATDALNFANGLAKQMESKLAKSREINIVRKEKLALSKNQRTLFQCCVNVYNSEDVTASTSNSKELDSDTELHIDSDNSD